MCDISRLTRVNQKEVEQQTLHSSIQEERKPRTNFFSETQNIFFAMSDSDRLDDGETSVQSEGSAPDDINVTKKPKKIHKLSLTETEDFNKKLKKRGVLYVARVPPRYVYFSLR